jgi:hypothetical protein
MNAKMSYKTGGDFQLVQQGKISLLGLGWRHVEPVLPPIHAQTKVCERL